MSQEIEDEIIQTTLQTDQDEEEDELESSIHFNEETFLKKYTSHSSDQDLYKLESVTLGGDISPIKARTTKSFSLSHNRISLVPTDLFLNRVNDSIKNRQQSIMASSRGSDIEYLIDYELINQMKEQEQKKMQKYISDYNLELFTDFFIIGNVLFFLILSFILFYKGYYANLIFFIATLLCFTWQKFNILKILIPVQSTWASSLLGFKDSQKIDQYFIDIQNQSNNTLEILDKLIESLILSLCNISILIFTLQYKGSVTFNKFIICLIIYQVIVFTVQQAFVLYKISNKKIDLVKIVMNVLIKQLHFNISLVYVLAIISKNQFMLSFVFIGAFLLTKLPTIDSFINKKSKKEMDHIFDFMVKFQLLVNIFAIIQIISQPTKPYFNPTFTIISVLILTAFNILQILQILEQNVKYETCQHQFNQFIFSLVTRNLKKNVQQNKSTETFKSKVEFIIQSLTEKLDFKYSSKKPQFQIVIQILKSVDSLQNIEKIEQQCPDQRNTKELNEFNFDPYNLKTDLSPNTYLHQTFHKILSKNSIYELFHIPFNKVQDFVHLIGKFTNLRQNHFNNNARNLEVFQKGQFLFEKLGIKNYCQLNEVEIFAFYFSLLISDFNHFGVENEYLEKINHDISILFNHQQQQQNHSVQYIFEIMLNNPEYNLVEHLNDDEYKLFRQLVIALVSTSESNFAANRDLIDILDHNMQQKEEFIPTNNDSKTSILQTVFNCAKCSYLAQDEDILSIYCSKLQQQLNNQVSLEQQHGLPTTLIKYSKIKDDKQAIICELISDQAIPYFELLKQYVQTKNSQVFIDKILKRLEQILISN